MRSMALGVVRAYSFVSPKPRVLKITQSSTPPSSYSRNSSQARCRFSATPVAQPSHMLSYNVPWLGVTHAANIQLCSMAPAPYTPEETPPPPPAGAAAVPSCFPKIRIKTAWKCIHSSSKVGALARFPLRFERRRQMRCEHETARVRRGSV